MVTITIYENQNKEYTAFRCMGHAEYAVLGEDIVCAAVSVLVINTINSVEHLVSDKFELATDQESGLIDFSLQEGYSKESLLSPSPRCTDRESLISMQSGVYGRTEAWT